MRGIKGRIVRKEYGRIYTFHNKTKKNTLVAWMQRKRFFCNRFLSKFQRKYCGKCYPKHKKLQDYIWYHANNLKVGDYV